MENHQIFNGKIHYKSSFSVAMLNYQRVHIPIQHGDDSWRPADFLNPVTKTALGSSARTTPLASPMVSLWPSLRHSTAALSARLVAGNRNAAAALGSDVRHEMKAGCFPTRNPDDVEDFKGFRFFSRGRVEESLN